MMRRLFAIVVVTVVGFTAWRAMQIAVSADIGRWLLWLIGLQFLSGISTVVFNWPLALATLHNAGAALMAVLLTQLNCHVAMRGQINGARLEQVALTA